MGKSILNSALSKVTGRIDGWVYRQRNGQLTIAKRPDFSAVVPTAAQLAARERFTSAADYGRQVLADPVALEFYAAFAKGTLSNAYAEAVTDFLKPPVVPLVDTSGYHGAVGDPITVTAIDKYGVTRVTVTLRDATQAVIEQGAAVLVNGKWTYTATTSVAVGESVIIGAAAVDRARQTGMKEVTLVVA